MLVSISRRLLVVAVFAVISSGSPQTAMTQAASPLEKPKENWKSVIEQVQRYSGTWDVRLITHNFKFAPAEYTGTMTATAIGSRWVVTELRSEAMGKSFSGHGIMGFDATTQKWRATWVDDVAPEMFIYEGDRDGSGIAMEARSGSQPYAEGARERRVDTWDGPDSYVSHFYKSSGGGEPQEFMTIYHKRSSGGAGQTRGPASRR